MNCSEHGWVLWPFCRSSLEDFFLAVGLTIVRITQIACPDLYSQAPLHLLSPSPEANVFSSLLTRLRCHPPSSWWWTSIWCRLRSFGHFPIWMDDRIPNLLCLILECLSTDLLATPALLSHICELLHPSVLNQLTSPEESQTVQHQNFLKSSLCVALWPPLTWWLG